VRCINKRSFSRREKDRMREEEHGVAVAISSLSQGERDNARWLDR
jgi:hypothetical protein